MNEYPPKTHELFIYLDHLNARIKMLEEALQKANLEIDRLQDHLKSSKCCNGRGHERVR